jgi:hypothetical protein
MSGFNESIFIRETFLLTLRMGPIRLDHHDAAVIGMSGGHAKGTRII